MRAFAPLVAASFLAVALATTVEAQTQTASIEIRVNAQGPDATFPFTGTGAGIPAAFQIRTSNGQGSTVYSQLDPNATLRSVNATAPSGWRLEAALCTTGHPWAITVWPGVTTTCVFQFQKTRSDATPPHAKPAKDAHAKDHDERERHDDDRDERGVGGGFGWWKHAARHVNATRLDGMVANVSNASAWLMPAGYAANGSGAASLLVDSTKHCQKRFGKLDCELHRFEARYLVLRLGLESQRLNGSANVSLENATAAYLGLPTNTTINAIVGAIEAKAGGPAETLAQLRMLRAASQRASAQG